MAPKDLIRSGSHQLYIDTIQKKCLSAFDNKRHILEDGVSSYAYGHYKIKNKELSGKNYIFLVKCMFFLVNKRTFLKLFFVVKSSPVKRLRIYPPPVKRSRIYPLLLKRSSLYPPLVKCSSLYPPLVKRSSLYPPLVKRSSLYPSTYSTHALRIKFK